MKKITFDGETWYEITDEKYKECLADETFDCWVEVNLSNSVYHVPLATIRAIRDDHKARLSGPDTLFGKPYVLSSRGQND